MIPSKQQLTREASERYFAKHAPPKVVAPIGETAMIDIAREALNDFDAKLADKRR